MQLFCKKNDYNIWDDVHNNNSHTHEYYDSIRIFNMSTFLKSDTIYVLHSTTKSNYDEILQQQTLFSSAGCLVGGIYSTPLIKDDEGLRVHNLGSYYSMNEIPKVIKQRSLINEEVKNLIIEIKGCNISKYNGINYLKMGEIHYKYFNKYSSLISYNIREQIIAQVNNTLMKSKFFLLETSKLLNRKLELDESIQYLNQFGKQSQHLSILSYAFFESLSDYIILNQNDDISNLYKQKNEIYNWNYKNIIFELYPFLLKRFNLEDIKFDLNQIVNKLKESNVIYNFNSEHFIISLCSKILKTINENFLNKVHKRDFEQLVNSTKLSYSNNLIPLVGHIIHKLMKKKEYSEIYSLVEQDKAHDIWKYWEENDILIISNDLIPKGEIGINPYLINKFKYNVYTCDNLIEKDKFYYIDKFTPVNVKIKPKLIEYKNSLLR